MQAQADNPAQPTSTEPRDIPTPPARRPVPAAGKAATAVFMDFSQSPREIVRVMSEAEQQAKRFTVQRRKKLTLIWLLFPAGLPFLIADFVLGYNICTFSLITLTLWVGAIAGLLYIRRQGKAPEFGSRFDLARTIFETIKDDVAPDKAVVGWLDLTGAEYESKATRQKTSQSGQPIIYYRDEWLRLKARLFDGNVLRVSIVEQVKARQGYWKRGRISGKNKWRAGSKQQQHELELSISLNPETYEAQPIPAQTQIPETPFVLEEATAGDGRVALSATATGSFDAWDILHTMRFGYNQLRKVSSS